MALVSASSQIDTVLADQNCDGGAVVANISSSLELQWFGVTLFGMGWDDNGRPYIANGTIIDNQVLLVVSGYGLAPENGTALTAFSGTLSDDVSVGNFAGVSEISVGGVEEVCDYYGTFTITDFPTPSDLPAMSGWGFTVLGREYFVES